MPMLVGFFFISLAVVTVCQEEIWMNWPINALPVTMPPYNRSGYNTSLTDKVDCFFYMEGVRIIATQKKDGVVPSLFPSADAIICNENATFKYTDEMVSCKILPNHFNNGVFTFEVDITSVKDIEGGNVNGFQFLVPKQKIHFNLTFKEDLQRYWSLVDVGLMQPLTIKASLHGNGFVDKKTTTNTEKSTGVGFMGINSVVGYGVKCGQSGAAWFTTDNPKILIGIALYNMQVQLRNVNASFGMYFNEDYVSCTGNFSIGSLMSIIAMLVFVGCLTFAMLMLNSIQTQSRFDSPRQKQLQINLRE